MSRVDGKTVQGIHSYLAARHHAAGPPRPPLYGNLPSSAPILTTLDPGIAAKYMLAKAKPAPDAAYMTGNGTVFRDQTTPRFISHPYRLEAVWKTQSPQQKLFYTHGRQTVPSLELPSFSPLYGGSGRLQQSSGTGLGRLQPLSQQQIESRSTGFFGA